MTWKSKYAVIQTLLLHVVKCHTNEEETQKGFTDPRKSVKFLVKEKSPSEQTASALAFFTDIAVQERTSHVDLLLLGRGHYLWDCSSRCFFSRKKSQPLFCYWLQTSIFQKDQGDLAGVSSLLDEILQENRFHRVRSPPSRLDSVSNDSLLCVRILRCSIYHYI